MGSIAMLFSAAWLERRAKEIMAGVVFCTRLPFHRAIPIASGTLAASAWAFPVAGLVVGFIGAAVYGFAHRAGLPPWPSAALAVAATMLVTGCLHEDGLADTADGLGGGKTREQKLSIMRDSRIGTYGVCVLTLSVVIRIAALASFGNGHLAVWALIAAHAAARAGLPALMFALPPARSDGLSFAAGRPPGNGVAAAFIIGFVILALCLRPTRAVVALIVLGIVGAAIAWLSSRQIGGQTGDVLGALEQVGEIAVLLVALG